MVPAVTVQIKRDLVPIVKAQGSKNVLHVVVPASLINFKMERGRLSPFHLISIPLDLEEEIKKGCQNLKNLLLVMSSFGGEEVIEI